MESCPAVTGAAPLLPTSMPPTARPLRRMQVAEPGTRTKPGTLLRAGQKCLALRLRLGSLLPRRLRPERQARCRTAQASTVMASWGS